MGFFAAESQSGSMIKLHFVDCMSHDLQFVGVPGPELLSARCLNRPPVCEDRRPPSDPQLAHYSSLTAGGTAGLTGCR